MKVKNLFYSILVLFLIFASTSLMACEDNGTVEEPTTNNEPVVVNPSVSLNYKNITVYEEDTFTLVATVSNSEDVVVWASSDDAVIFL